jgi:hypothetical protein
VSIDGVSMNQKTSTSINKGALVKRGVPLADKVVNVDAIVKMFNNKQGVVQVRANEGAPKLWIKYDASLIQIDDIIAPLILKGIWTSGSWWPRIRLDWYRFEDKNALKNATSNNSHCSNKPPRGH